MPLRRTNPVRQLGPLGCDASTAVNSCPLGSFTERIHRLVCMYVHIYLAYTHDLGLQSCSTYPWASRAACSPRRGPGDGGCSRCPICRRCFRPSPSPLRSSDAATSVVLQHLAGEPSLDGRGASASPEVDGASGSPRDLAQWQICGRRLHKQVPVA
ncbi:hypothetical protein L209DRAFT_315500 [Thermothelomyces heterothallicus CBS 203.75]